MGGRADGYRWRKRRCFETGNAQNHSGRNLSTRIFSPYSKQKRHVVTRSLKEPKRSFLRREIQASAAIRLSSSPFHHQREARTCQEHPRVSATPTSQSLPSSSSERSSLMRDLGREVPRLNQIPLHFTDTTSPLPLSPQDLSANNLGKQQTSNTSQIEKLIQRNSPHPFRHPSPTTSRIRIRILANHTITQ